MPKKLQIEEGPPFKSFVFKSTIFDDHGWTLTFKFDGAISEPAANFEKERTATMTIIVIGQIKSDNDDEYMFIATRKGDTRYKKGTCTFLGITTFYYLGSYNPRTRKGHCTEYSDEEFFASSIMKDWFKKK